MSRDSAAIRDQLGNDPDTTFYLNADYDETVGVEEGSTIIKTHTLGHAWIVGSITNGIVGANTNTEDGEQQTVGGGGRVETVVRVTNPNNVFHEHFKDNTFTDTARTTATVDLTDFRVEF